MIPSKILLVCAVFLALCSASFAAEYWVIRGDAGSMLIVDRKPMDAGVIIQGPFATRKEADTVLQAGTAIPGGPASALATPPGSMPARVQYWVVRGTLGSLMIVDREPRDAGAIVQGPFANRHEAERVVTAGVALPGTPMGPQPVVSAPARGEYYVVRGTGGALMVVDSKPSDSGVIIQGPFATHADAYKVIAGGGPVPEIPATAGSGETGR